MHSIIFWLTASSLKTTIYFQNRRSFLYQSKKGQSPFVILNGQEIPDSNVAIERLTRQFHVDLEENLTEDQKAVSLALQRMIENHTCWYVTWPRIKEVCVCTHICMCERERERDALQYWCITYALNVWADRALYTTACLIATRILGHRKEYMSWWHGLLFHS